MIIYIKRSFNDSKMRLSSAEARRVDKAIQRLQHNPNGGGFNIERLTSNPDFSSIRVNRSIRVIFFSRFDDLYLCYVAAHDEAYRWGETHRREERVGRGIIVLEDDNDMLAESLPLSFGNNLTIAESLDRPTPETIPQERLGSFSMQEPEFLMELGVPQALVEAVRSITTEDELFQIGERVPDEVLDNLIALAEGEIPASGQRVSEPEPEERGIPPQESNWALPFDETVESFVEQDFENWQLFLHPSQRSAVEGTWSGPVKVTGPAGTGKTVVAVHRAKYLASRGLKVWVTTFSRGLANEIRHMLEKLCSEAEMTKISVSNVHSLATSFCRKPLVTKEHVRTRIDEQNDGGFPSNFLREEWELVFEGQAITSIEEYLDADRTGRGRGLSREDRGKIFEIFDPFITLIRSGEKSTYPHRCRVASVMSHDSIGSDLKFDAVIIDEIQDLGAPEIRFIQSMLRGQSSELFLIGDGGQKIYRKGFSFRQLGIETRGRSVPLRCNYRTGRAIYDIARRIRSNNSSVLGDESEDGGIVRSVLEGEMPQFKGYEDYSKEIENVVRSVNELLDGQGVPEYKPSEIAIICRTRRPLNDLKGLLSASGRRSAIVERDNNSQAGFLSLSTMHNAKGRTYRAVFIVNCGVTEMPFQDPDIEPSDESEREAVLEREKNLLYVSMTRARDKLEVSWSSDPSIFLVPILAEITD